MSVQGWTAPGYGPVRAAFAADPRGGSALTVLRDGRPVVELHEGWRDAARTVPWTPDTLVQVYSAGKPVAALAVLVLVARGRVGLDERVAAYWPGFTADATVRHALAHAAGLPVFPVPRGAAAWPDWDLLCADLAAARPRWQPGTVGAEHALTYGHLLGELVRRVDGRAPAAFTAAELAGPWGLDLAYALGPADRARCAELEWDRPERPASLRGAPGSLHERAIGNPAGVLDPAVVNGDAWRGAAVPAVNVHATAGALAGLYARLLAGGAPVLDPATAAQVARPQVHGDDPVLGRRVAWAMGVQVEPDGTWGMGGLGGSCGWADPRTGHTVGYVTRRLGDFTVADAVERALPGNP